MSQPIEFWMKQTEIRETALKIAESRIVELEAANLKKAYVESTLVQLQQLYLKYKLKYVKSEEKLKDKDCTCKHCEYHAVNFGYPPRKKS